MHGTRTSGRRMRRLAIAAMSACAVIGASLAGASAANAAGSGLIDCVATTTSTGLAATGAGVVQCIVPTAPVPTAPVPSAPATEPTATPTAPTAAPVAVPTTTAAPAPTTTTTASSAGSGSLQTVRLITTTNTVYPEAKGYSKSVVRFSVRGLTAAQTGVRITGDAVLRKGSEVVKTWPISNATTMLTWNGRNGSKVETGLYRLTATAWSSDGAKAVSAMSVRVSGKHLVTRTVSIRTRDLAKARTDTLPIAVVKGFEYGPVTLRIHTFAKVAGKARLVIAGPYGERFSIALRDGRHVTPRATLPREFTSAAFHHDWKKGAAQLLDLYTVFTYKQLV